MSVFLNKGKLQHQVNKKISKNKGFTLIELLIVIGIIAVLAAAVIIAINPGHQFVQARNAARNSHIDSIKKAVVSYQIYNQGNNPSCIPDYPGVVNISSCPELDEDFISDTPVDPQGENYMIGFSNPFHEMIKVYSEAPEYLLNKSFICGDPVYYEGQIYQTIQLGSYCWFAENLNVGDCEGCI